MEWKSLSLRRSSNELRRTFSELEGRLVKAGTALPGAGSCGGTRKPAVVAVGNL